MCNHLQASRKQDLQWVYKYISSIKDISVKYTGKLQKAYVREKK